MIKLLATDLDGTFLNSNRTISPANKAAIKKLNEAGIQFSIASGRSIATIAPILSEIECSGPAVTTNGALVIGNNGEEILHRTLPQSAHKLITDYAEAQKIHLNSYYGYETRFSDKGEFAELYISRTGTTPTFQSYKQIKEGLASKLLFIDHPQNILRYRAELSPQLEEFGISIVISEPDYLEFLAPNINKGEGLKSLCSALNIPLDSVAAIGDYTNDTEMMKYAGWPAAVSNAHPDILQLAKTIVKSNDQDGFSEFADLVIQANRTGILMP